MNSNTLYILSGLPGVGKTTLSKLLAAHVGAVYLRIDTIEQALKDLCEIDVQSQGYTLAYRIAADNLRLGLAVVADSCNPIELTRRDWEAVADASKSAFKNIEVICSDIHQHQKRIETRIAETNDHLLPDWHDVIHREYQAWSRSRIVIDTADRTPDDSLSELLQALDKK